jgi:hypothetical protein
MEIPGNTKLAIDPSKPSKDRVLIETRGEGGYAIVPGSPPACHPAGRTYEHHAGPKLSQVRTVTAAERETLIRCARSFNREGRLGPSHSAGRNGSGLSPGDDFNRRAVWAEVLQPHGWELARERGDVRHWRRPGKGEGISATTGHCRNEQSGDLLFVFSSNAAPFEDGRTYNKFGAYALLNHKGDWKAAAKELARQGYGERSTKSDKQGQSESPGADALATTCLATIRPEPVRWLVPGYLPLGKLVLVAGDGGHGKSTLTLDLTANLTTGRPCLGLAHEPLSPCDVLLVSCEDDYADTILPRLLSAGADLDRVWRVDGIRDKDGKVLPFNLASYEALEKELKAKPNVRFVVIDPAGAYVGKTGIDDHKDSELRALLGPLAELAARTQVTILLVKHLVKGATARAVHKVGGSAGYVNTVRAAFVLAPDSEDEDKKLFLPLKFNLGCRPSGLAFRTCSLDAAEQRQILDAYGQHLDEKDRERLAGQLFRITWEGAVDITADAVMAENARREKGPGKVDQAAEWLERFLAEYAYPHAEVVAAGEAAGHSRDNLFRARTKLADKIKASNKGRFGGQWFWGPGHPATWVIRPTADTAETAETADNADNGPAILSIVRNVSNASSVSNGDEPPKQSAPCPYAEHRRRWRSTYGVLLCATCAPPADEKLVAEWIEEAER